MDRREAIKKTAYLLGSTISATTAAAILNGCQPTGQPDWQPKTLSLSEARLTGEIAETILPTSDTPGAKELFVDEFIDLMLTDCSDQKTIDQFKAGLGEVDQSAKTNHGKPFIKCSPTQQQEMVRQLDNNKKDAPFFRLFKELTLLGYFTSEYAMTELINFNPVPGSYKGCIDSDEKTLVEVNLNV